jgi:hypothetical protein
VTAVNAFALRRRSGIGAVLCAAVLLSSAACAAGQPAAGPSAAPVSPAGAEVEQRQASGGRVGAAGSPCELPVSFQLGDQWQAESVDAEGGPLEDLARVGSLTMACEIKGRSAGYIAFLRVWIGPSSAGGPRQALAEYLGNEQGEKPMWSDLTLGGAPATEVVYSQHNELLDEVRTKRAFAVKTPTGVAVVTLDGLEAQEDAVVAAFELAKKTLTVGA